MGTPLALTHQEEVLGKVGLGNGRGKRMPGKMESPKEGNGGHDWKLPEALGVSPGIRNECELSPERWWVVVEGGC